MIKLACVAIAVVLGFGGLVAANGPKQPANPPKPESNTDDKPADDKPADGKPKDGEKPANPTEAKAKLERPSLDPSKVPGVPAANGGLMCVNPGGITAVGKFVHHMKADGFATADVCAVPFSLDGKKSIATLAELDPIFAKIRKDKVRPGERSWVIADIRVVPAGSSQAEAEAWLGTALFGDEARIGNKTGNKVLWDLAVKEKAELIAVFMVSQSAPATADAKPRNSGEVMLLAVKNASSAVDARVIGFVD